MKQKKSKYISFEKEDLINLRFSLSKEILNTNKSRAYSYTTILGCNTRKYHGLLVVNLPSVDNQKHVLLSTLDVSVIQHENRFDLGIHKYPGGVFFPKGHKFARRYEYDKLHKVIYRVGGVVLSVEKIFEANKDRILLKYKVLESPSPIKLAFSPFLAFRNFHHLTRKNSAANTGYKKVRNGISVKMYDNYPNLFLQFSKKPHYEHKANWNMNIEYQKDQIRGYEYTEDLFVPGEFTIPMKKGESVVFCGSVEAIAPSTIAKKFSSQIKTKPPRDNFLECIWAASNQFIEEKFGATTVNAGFPWFGPWGRDTLISLGGLTLAKGDVKTFERVIKTLLKGFKDGLFPNLGTENSYAYNSVDSPLLFFYTMQHYADVVGSKKVYRSYGKYFRTIIRSFLSGKLAYNIRVDDNALVYQGDDYTALTWMDAIVDGVPVTKRKGYAVEINALWYNALCFCLKMAKNSSDKKFISEIKDLPQRVKESFLNFFWNEQGRYLADCADYDSIDFSVRPNQIFAVSLPYSMLSDGKKIDVLRRVSSELLTPKGLRTLSPKNINYKSFYSGGIKARDAAYHQGTVWPWLLQEYANALVGLHGKNALGELKDILFGFEEDMFTYGIGTIPEIYDADPPHNPKGAISQAWSVGALLWINKLIKDIEGKK